jgi:predicted Zn-dependent protease with MMP-like domain
LFGLYVGVPLTERQGGGGALPDRIVIFQGPLERHVPSRRLATEVRRTVVHEIAHHFGISDARLAELGLD